MTITKAQQWARLANRPMLRELSPQVAASLGVLLSTAVIDEFAHAVLITAATPGLSLLGAGSSKPAAVNSLYDSQAPGLPQALEDWAMTTDKPAGCGKSFLYSPGENGGFDRRSGYYGNGMGPNFFKYENVPIIDTSSKTPKIGQLWATRDDQGTLTGIGVIDQNGNQVDSPTLNDAVKSACADWANYCKTPAFQERVVNIALSALTGMSQDASSGTISSQ